MSLPGLGAIPGLGTNGLGALSSIAQTAPRELVTRNQNLLANTEWRFEVPFNRQIRVRNISGEAEYFGTELAPNRDYIFKGVKGAIFTYFGCMLEIEGSPENDYVGNETEMTMAYNIHFALEELRNTAQIKRAVGPRVLFVGPNDTGKTSMVKVLTSYAIKMDRQPIAVNLDPSEGVLSIPGAFTATMFAEALEIEEPGGWGNSAISGPSQAPTKMPLVYHYGCQTAEENKPLFKSLVTRLALAVTSRLESEDLVAKSSGVFIDTSGSMSSGKDSYELIKHIISEFSVNAIMVMGSEKLFQDMTRLFAAGSNDEGPIAVVKIPKAEGCVSRDEAYMREFRREQIRHYFFGSSSSVQLSPYLQWVDFANITLYKTTDLTQQQNSEFRPGDADDQETKTTIYQKIMPSHSILNEIVAVTNAAANDSQEAIRDSSTLAYLYVAEVDEAGSRMRVLSTLSGRVPANALVMGSWPEGIPGLT